MGGSQASTQSSQSSSPRNEPHCASREAQKNLLCELWNSACSVLMLTKQPHTPSPDHGRFASINTKLAEFHSSQRNKQRFARSAKKPSLRALELCLFCVDADKASTHAEPVSWTVPPASTLNSQSSSPRNEPHCASREAQKNLLSDLWNSACSVLMLTKQPHTPSPYHGQVPSINAELAEFQHSQRTTLRFARSAKNCSATSRTLRALC